MIAGAEGYIVAAYAFAYVALAGYGLGLVGRRRRDKAAKAARKGDAA